MSLRDYHPSSRPSPLTGGWLPDDHRERLKLIGHLKDKLLGGRRGEPGELVHQSVKDLGDYIDNNALVSMLFTAMFEEIPYAYRQYPGGENPFLPGDDKSDYEILHVETLLQLFDAILEQAPICSANGIVASPFTLLLEWPMKTRAGIAAFLLEGVNIRLKAVLDEWGQFLQTDKRSASGLNKEGWFSPNALAIMKARDYQHADFNDLFVCPDPSAENRGFTTWDAFFTRAFKPSARPVEPPPEGGDPADYYIASACESSPYAIKQRVKATEKFWIKGQPYSLKHMLACDVDKTTNLDDFIGGTVYQAFLSPFTYHRWHSPISGTITKIVLITGTYFSIAPVNGFPNPETLANTRSQAYLSAVATRAVIYLQNNVVGKMILIPIGMVEVSTCAVDERIMKAMTKDEQSSTPTVQIYTGSYAIGKGDQVGMFHFGGSTHCLVFNKDVTVNFWREALPSDDDDWFVPLKSIIAHVVKKKSKTFNFS